MDKKYTSLEEVRFFLAQNTSSSETTPIFQANVFEQVINCLGSAEYVIEVGISRGGLSCQLAFLLENTGKKLILIDIAEECIQWTKHLIQELGITTTIIYFTGTFQQFVDAHPDIQPSFIIIDAGHTYDEVTQDIRTLKRMKYQPPAVAFHDFSLRYGRSSLARLIRVDRAVIDQYLRNGHKYQEIGASDEHAMQRILSISESAGNYYYHDCNYPEGIMVITDEKKFMTYSPYGWKRLKAWPSSPWFLKSRWINMRSRWINIVRKNVLKIRNFLPYENSGSGRS